MSGLRMIRKTTWKLRQLRPGSARFALPSIIIFLAGMVLLLGSLYFDGTSFLRLAGFPADRLHHPRVQRDFCFWQMGLATRIGCLPSYSPL